MERKEQGTQGHLRWGLLPRFPTGLTALLLELMLLS